ncbi:MAG TPA: hypothetical protein IGS37_10010 [Synechococcales cyanobacterium M55_K2018_004]|nr:hypothetical protein [Synechococcales cyanobacterium M55_K2018_004]
MANASVFTGADGALLLSAPQSAEGGKAQPIIDANQFSQVVGRLQNVKVEVVSDVKPFHEIGQRYATELRPGNINIRGSIGRAYINGALLSLLLGDAAAGKPAEIWMQPAFNITLMLKNPANPDVQNTVTLHDVKIDSWVYSIPEDDFVMESVGFKALYITVEDAG